MPRSHRRLPAALLVLIGVLVPAVRVSALPATGTGAAIAWHTCDVSFRCGVLPVPISYNDPAAGSLDLSVIELPATGPAPKGDVLTNPGGPGASGVQFLEGQTFPASLRASFNIVSFDPRGIGASDPVHCVGPAGLRSILALNPDPTTPAAVKSVVAATKAFDEACAQHTSRLLLENVGTVDTARDLDRLRAALGQPKLYYLGFSYGTYLGELYAQLFPTHIEAMVLDGVVNPDLGPASTEAEQARAFSTELDDFFSWCNATTSCNNELAGRPQGEFDQLISSLESGATLPAHLTPAEGGTQSVDIGIAEVGVVATLYTPATWPLLGEAIAHGVEGDGTVFAALAYSYAGMQPNGTFSNLEAANVAISCADSPVPHALSSYESLARKLDAETPLFGGAEAWGGLGCVYWPVRPSEAPHVIRAELSPPILVIGSTGDPATPYLWAQQVARMLAHGVLLTRSGPGHTGYFTSACVQRDVLTYFLSGATPHKGSVCAT